MTRRSARTAAALLLLTAAAHGQPPAPVSDLSGALHALQGAPLDLKGGPVDLRAEVTALRFEVENMGVRPSAEPRATPRTSRVRPERRPGSGEPGEPRGQRGLRSVR